MGEVVTTWTDLPDPRGADAPAGMSCSVLVTWDAVLHIADKHVRNPHELWAEWLDPELYGRLQQPFPQQPEQVKQLLIAVAQSLEQGARHAFRRPLVLIVDGGKVFLLVLPNGALMVIKEIGNKLLLRTCYFIRRVCAFKNRTQRWRKLVERLVLRYTVWQADLGLQPPGGQERSPESGQAVQVRFVTLEQWGFVSGPQGYVWRGRLVPWPGQPTPAKAHPKVTLRPRQQAYDRQTRPLSLV